MLDVWYLPLVFGSAITLATSLFFFLRFSKLSKVYAYELGVKFRVSGWVSIRVSVRVGLRVNFRVSVRVKARVRCIFYAYFV